MPECKRIVLLVLLLEKLGPGSAEGLPLLKTPALRVVFVIGDSSESAPFTAFSVQLKPPLSDQIPALL